MYFINFYISDQLLCILIYYTEHNRVQKVENWLLSIWWNQFYVWPKEDEWLKDFIQMVSWKCHNLIDCTMIRLFLYNSYPNLFFFQFFFFPFWHNFQHNLNKVFKVKEKGQLNLHKQTNQRKKLRFYYRKEKLVYRSRKENF